MEDEQDRDLIEREHRHRLGSSKTKAEHKIRQNKFATQRSILKNSQDHTMMTATTTNEDLELLEAKKQIILRRRRLFSHYRQYQEWRRRQFSYDPCSYRVIPPPLVAPSFCSSGLVGTGVDYTVHSTNPNAFRRRRQYRRQFSCAERSREDSRESRDSSQLANCQSMGASGTIRTDSTPLNNTNPTTERHSFDSSECGALAYQPLHCSRHFHVFPEEHSASISERITRSRINSAIFVSTEGRGFDSIEFLRRHGSQSVLCRKAKSAENITDNGRKKSFAENSQWHGDGNNGNDDAHNDNTIELQECSRSVENHPVAVLKNNVEKLLAATSVLNHSATVTTSNMIVGSISIEAPPSHIREEQKRAVIIPPPPPPPPLFSSAKTVSSNSASHDSADTVEELVSIPLDISANTNTITSTTTPILNPAPTKSRVLVRQRSSTASPILSSTQSSPQALKLKCITPKLNKLPMVSVSGPSPPDEKPPPGECL